MHRCVGNVRECENPARCENCEFVAAEWMPVFAWREGEDLYSICWGCIEKTPGLGEFVMSWMTEVQS